MKIAFFGSSLVSAYWNGAATYYRGLLRALAERGQRVCFFEPDAFDRQQHRDIADPDWARVIVYEATESGVRAALRDVGDADLVVKASGVGVFDGFLEEAIFAAGPHSSLRAFWDVDAPATLARVAASPDDPFKSLIPRYDIIFTYGGGPRVVEGYHVLGARRCVPIYNALDPSTHYPVAPDPRYAADLLFIGHRLPDRRERVAEFFLNVASALPNRRFLIGGNGWGDEALPANVEPLGHVFTHQHNRLNCSARAVLNVNRDSMATFGYSPPTRFFEAAGAGACLITDAWDGIEAFLSPGDEVLVAATGCQVTEIVANLSQERAQAIGAAARQKILAQHTYAQRAVVVEDALSQTCVGRAA